MLSIYTPYLLVIKDIEGEIELQPVIWHIVFAL